MSGTRKRTRNGDVTHSDAPPAKRNTCTLPAPFHYEDRAKHELASVDYTVRITKEMGENGTAPRPIRIYADGIYDMFHSGHARQLQQAKACFPKSHVYLIVGVCDDELTHDMKGMTVMNEAERYEAVRHCRYVDELVTGAPWTLDEDFLTERKIDFVAHDDLPYGGDNSDDIYKWIKDKGMFVTTQRTEGISTTDVITRIIKDYDVYVRRNLSRGYSPKDLNVGFMKARKLQFQTKVETMKGKLADKRAEIMDKGRGIINEWEEKSRDFVGNFIRMFGGDGRVNNWITEKRISIARAISPPNTPDMSTKRRTRSNDSLSRSPEQKKGRLMDESDSDAEDDDEDEDDDNQASGPVTSTSTLGRRSLSRRSINSM